MGGLSSLNKHNLVQFKLHLKFVQIMNVDLSVGFKNCSVNCRKKNGCIIATKNYSFKIEILIISYTYSK